MIPPREQWAIEIDVTNACPRRCSNCTRHTGHVREPFFMSEGQLVEAARALRDFPTDSPPPAAGQRKSVGLIGGEPQCHPNFERLCELFVEHGPPSRYHRNLYTAIPVQRSPHREQILRTFGWVNENLHDRDCRHQPILVGIQDVVADRREMWRLIDRCWVNRLWSATITPRGFFFCEVAAALDLLFDGPGGLPVTPNVWRWDLDCYREQIETWCPRCGAAVPLPGRLDADEKDDVGRANLAALQIIKSPGLSRCVPFEGRVETEPQRDWQPYLYLGAEVARPTFRLPPPEGDGQLRELGARALTVCVEYDDLLALTLPRMLLHFAEVWVVTSPADTATRELVARHERARLFVTDAFYRSKAVFNKGLAIEECFDAMGRQGWLAVVDADVLLPEELPRLALDHQKLHSPRRRICDDPQSWDGSDNWQVFRRHSEVEFAGYFQLFHAGDPVLAKSPWYGTTWRHAGGCDSEFQSRWPREAKIHLPFDVLHLGPIDTNWYGRASDRIAGQPSPLADQRRAATRRTLQMLRYHGPKYEHLGRPDERLAEELRPRIDSPATADLVAGRLAVCRPCGEFRCDWCRDAPGPGSGPERLADQLVAGGCQKFGGPQADDYVCLMPFRRLNMQAARSRCCCIDTKADYGTIWDHSLMEIWNHPDLLRFRREMLARDFSRCPKDCHELVAVLANEPGCFRTPRSQLPADVLAAGTQGGRMERGPSLFSLDMDQSCNLYCVMCRPTRIDRDLDQAQAARTVEAIAEAKAAGLQDLVMNGCGDCFYSRWYDQVLRQADLSGLGIKIFTNGLYATPRRFDEMGLARCDSVHVSIDAATAETYAKVRRGGDWQTLLENLEGLTRMRVAGRIGQLNLGFLVLAENFREIPPFVRFARVHGADVISLQQVNGNRERAVHLPDHPQYAELVEVMRAKELAGPGIHLWGQIATVRRRSLSGEPLCPTRSRPTCP